MAGLVLVIKSGLTVIVDELDRVAKGVSILATNRVMVGIPADKALRRPENGEPTPINNAALGYIHENGAPEVGIPARPWLVPGVREHSAESTRGLRVAGELALDGKGPDKVLRQLQVVGLRAQAAVRRKITEGPFVPLKPATIAARRRRSKGSKYRRKAETAADVRPLIDTSQMRSAVNYVIRKVGHK